MQAEIDPFFRLDDRDMSEYSLSIYGGTNKSVGYEFGFNTNSQRDFGALASLSKDAVSTSFLSGKTFSAPYFGFSETGFSGKLNLSTSKHLDFSFGLATTDEEKDFGLRSNAAVLEGTYKVGERATIGLQAGQLSESGSLFGGSSGGAFSVDSSDSLSVGVSGTYRLNDRITLIGNYSEARTRVAQRDNSLLHDFSDIRSNAYGVGMVIDTPFTRRDQVGFAFSQPLRVTQGHVNLEVPYARDFEGNIYKNSEIVDLAPDGRERTFEAYYKFNLHKDTDVFTYLMHQQQPAHDNTADDAATVFMTLRHRF